MSCVIAGTVPYEDFPLADAEAILTREELRFGGHTIPVARGTAALAATCSLAATALGIRQPRIIVAGDIGRGNGSTEIYRYLVERLSDIPADVLVFHYFQPDVDWHNRILIKIEELAERPLLVADAGYMYVAKMSGFSKSYDLFTPDAGEMAFLADESAPHPFYTRGFLLKEEERIPELIRRAYENDNAPHYLLVKGRKDVVASRKGIISEIANPCVENMEPIGGTGDSLTGVVAALLAAGRTVPDAAKRGAEINRLMGLFANPSPASSVGELLPYLPRAMTANDP